MAKYIKDRGEVENNDLLVIAPYVKIYDKYIN